MMSLIEQAAERLAQLRQAGAGTAETVSSALPPHTAEPHDLHDAHQRAPLVARPSSPLPTPHSVQPDAVAAEPVAAVLDASPANPSSSSPVPAAARAPSSSRQVVLNLEALSAAGIETPNGPRSNKGDQYRVIKRPLIKNAMNRGASPIQHANLIMVTSALAGEGKSFTSINLAMSIAAELDNTVMLVDADVARPSLLRVLGMQPSPGLLDILESSVDLSSVLLRTNVEKLTILPSGSPHPRATELLASEAMRQLLNDMANRYADRIIIFDSPPLLLTTESRVLATHMGQIVVVVQADKTLQKTVEHALATIEACPVKMMLLNQAKVDTKGGYEYGYGYGYGYGSAPGERGAGAA